MAKPRLRQRAFKRLAFFTTVGGILVMAVGLQRLLIAGQWVLSLVLLLAGGALALTSALVEIVPEPRFVVILYTREDCALCDEARALLSGWRSRYDFDLWEVDVDQDPNAASLYGDEVPVGLARRGEHTEELFRLAAGPAALEDALHALSTAAARR